jgi:hypothetical protein
MTTDHPRIADLVARFTPEGVAGTPPIGFGDHYVFFVGRDDCHGILHYLIPQEKLAFPFNMFGFDDDELNDDILGLMGDPHVTVTGTFDRSQAGGVHERKIIEHDLAVRPDLLNFFAVGQSASHQISHTKGGVFTSLGLGFEGSMNWSASGEGTGISLRPDVKAATGYKAQNNTLLVSANPVFLSRFTARLSVEHSIALAQQAARQAAGKP